MKLSDLSRTTDTRLGKVEKATTTETLNGTADKYPDAAAIKVERDKRLLAADNLSDVGSAATAFTNIKQPASTTSTGVVEKATTAEAEAGTADKYPDAAGVHAAFGQYGLGGPLGKIANVDDLNKPSGTYLVDTDATGVLPSGFIIGHLVYSRETAYNTIVQTLYSVSGSFDDGDVRIFKRRYFPSASEWRPWQEVFTQNSIIGTVSQSAGVPTGSIIERGSNANGEYVKFAGGTLECWHTLPTVNVDNGTSEGFYFPSPQTWTFPVPFQQAPSVTQRVQKQSSGGMLFPNSSNATVTASECNGLSMGATQSGQSGYQMVMAKGRWY